MFGSGGNTHEKYNFDDKMIHNIFASFHLCRPKKYSQPNMRLKDTSKNFLYLMISALYSGSTDLAKRYVGFAKWGR